MSQRPPDFLTTVLLFLGLVVWLVILLPIVAFVTNQAR